MSTLLPTAHLATVKARQKHGEKSIDSVQFIAAGRGIASSRRWGIAHKTKRQHNSSSSSSRSGGMPVQAAARVTEEGLPSSLPSSSTDMLQDAERASPAFARLHVLQQELMQQLVPQLQMAPMYTTHSNEGPAAAFRTERTLCRIECFAGPQVRWLLKTNFVKKGDSGASIAGIRINVFHAATSCAPNFDVEVFDNGPAGLLMYFNLPPRVDLLMQEGDMERFYCSPAAGGGSLQDLLREVQVDPDTTPFRSSSPYVRLLQAASGITIGLPATDTAVDKACGWAHRAASIFLDLSGRTSSAVLDPVRQGQLEARDKKLLQIFRKDPSNFVLEQEFGKDGAESILRVCTKDPRVMVEEARG